MTRPAMYKTLRQYPGSFVWISRTLNVRKALLSRWFNTSMTSPTIDPLRPQIEQMVVAARSTRGGCVPPIAKRKPSDESQNSRK